MAPNDDGYRYNSDLLADPADVTQARIRFPNLMHVLEHRELIDEFGNYDRPANQAKKDGRDWGVIAVMLGSIALMVAAAAPLLKDLPEDCARLLECLAALCGVASVVLGIRGVLWSRAKAKWLKNRLVTERLRQFHFQAMVFRWNELVASLSGKPAEDNYRKQREAWFATFKARIIDGREPEFTDLVSENPASGPWLFNEGTPAAVADPGPALGEQIFAAYRELRIEYQLGYANLKLGEASGFLPTTIRAQIKFFSNMALFGIAALLIIHLLIAGAFAIGGRSLEPPPWVNVVAIWIAIAALAMRALEEGLQPARELERYRTYRADLHQILQRFNHASTIPERLETMREMEQLSFDEMVDFLKTHNEARYVM
ncbi:hypothetical protein UNPF46_21365 [Bradyrhizobium sp. UNPF46]|uniref:hypothetical protein n=1 Tax=Bradyrhizobium sp. UNPF46 TaxID=1141168 RepID=UPI00114E3666|nr:hypothetical protein [Bradyrhizobium sp. UNPF46]TQF36706.1 hypothetical protein UNPF46_21365 [Bradyrhizobium sp. UNPF46]